MCAQVVAFNQLYQVRRVKQEQDRPRGPTLVVRRKARVSVLTWYLWVLQTTRAAAVNTRCNLSVTAYSAPASRMLQQSTHDSANETEWTGLVAKSMSRSPDAPKLPQPSVEAGRNNVGNVSVETEIRWNRCSQPSNVVAGCYQDWSKF